MITRKSRMIALCTIVVFSGCASYEFSNKSSSEKTFVSPLTYEEPVTLMEVIDMNNPASSRGLITTDVLIQGTNLAIQGVKSLIDKSQEKFNQQYLGGLSNLKFYATNSKSGMMDPDKISFRGFELTRSFQTKNGDREVAVFARFVLDEAKMEDIYFNSKFYLKLDSISVNYSKVKINDRKWYLPWSWFVKKEKNINVDMDVDVRVNWIDDHGVIHADVPFGHFTLPLRNVPMNPDDPERSEYFQNLMNTPLAGSSYIIPRSITYCTGDDGDLSPCYGRGDFSIGITVTESSKSDFVTQKLNEHSNDIFDNINAKDVLNALDKKKN